MIHNYAWHCFCVNLTFPSVQLAVVGNAQLGVNSDASCMITYAYQFCLLHLHIS